MSNSKKRGGVLLKEKIKNVSNNNTTFFSNDEEAIRYFIKRSVVSSLFCTTKGGTILKLSLAQHESPFYKIRSKSVRNYLENKNKNFIELKTILLKIVPISDHIVTEIDQDINIMTTTDVNINTDNLTVIIPDFKNVNKKENRVIVDYKHKDFSVCNTDYSQDLVSTETFENEVNIQKDIYSNSYDEYLEPLCPQIIFSTIQNIEDCDLMGIQAKTNIRKNDKLTSLLFDKYKSLITNSNLLKSFKLGFIFMEEISEINEQQNTSTNSFNNMHFFYTNSKKTNKTTLSEKIRLQYWYELYKLSLMGYVHGDFHMGNCMYDANYDNYFDGMNGRPYLLDFGRSSTIEKRLCKLVGGDPNFNGDYRDILRKQNIEKLTDDDIVNVNINMNMYLLKLCDMKTDILEPSIIIRDNTVSYGQFLGLCYEYYQTIQDINPNQLNIRIIDFYYICKYFLFLLIDISFISVKYGLDSYCKTDEVYNWVKELIDNYIASPIFQRNKFENILNRREISKQKFSELIRESPYKNIVKLIIDLDVSVKGVHEKFKGMKKITSQYLENLDNQYVKNLDKFNSIPILTKSTTKSITRSKRRLTRTKSNPLSLFSKTGSTRKNYSTFKKRMSL